MKNYPRKNYYDYDEYFQTRTKNKVGTIEIYLRLVSNLSICKTFVNATDLSCFNFY